MDEGTSSLDQTAVESSCLYGRISLQFEVCGRKIACLGRDGERLDPANVIQHDRFGGGSVMVWGGISHRAKTDLVTVHGNLNAMRCCNEIVQPALLRYFLRQGHATIFQQDNGRGHVARHTMNFLQANDVNVLDWPARSPDISPIEHLWDHLGRRVREMTRNNVRDLERVLLEEWTRIPKAVVHRFTSSMRRRCGAVIDSNGGHTRY